MVRYIWLINYEYNSSYELHTCVGSNLHIVVINILVIMFSTVSSIVTVVTDPPGVTLYQDTTIDFICTVMIDDAVDTPNNVSLEWEGLTNLTVNTDYTITSSSNRSTLHFNHLLTSYTGRNITCRATVILLGLEYSHKSTNKRELQLSVLSE